ncbi:MAG: DUF2281 domain-containing protein [Candidatus Wallbacteria bacterium]|nr:DUF2281 domain-containing protein [Candidatus Wallbacteria bacterium]
MIFFEERIAMARATVQKPNFAEVVSQAKKLSPAQRAKLVRVLTDDLEAESITPVRHSKRPLSELAACGMWKDREDMKDSVKWVQELRRREERRWER